MKTETAFSDTS